MLFYDWEPHELPKDAAYYYNIYLISIAIHPKYAKQKGIEFEDYWDLQKILDPRPIVYHFYMDEDLEDCDYEIEQIPHCVIETDPHLGVSFYQLIDFYTQDPWALDPEYDEDEDEECFH